MYYECTSGKFKQNSCIIRVKYGQFKLSRIFMNSAELQMNWECHSCVIHEARMYALRMSCMHYFFVAFPELRRQFRTSLNRLPNYAEFCANRNSAVSTAKCDKGFKCQDLSVNSRLKMACPGKIIWFIYFTSSSEDEEKMLDSFSLAVWTAYVLLESTVGSTSYQHCVFDRKCSALVGWPQITKFVHSSNTLPFHLGEYNALFTAKNFVCTSI